MSTDDAALASTAIVDADRDLAAIESGADPATFESLEDQLDEELEERMHSDEERDRRIRRDARRAGHRTFSRLEWPRAQRLRAQ